MHGRAPLTRLAESHFPGGFVEGFLMHLGVNVSRRYFQLLFLAI